LGTDGLLQRADELSKANIALEEFLKASYWPAEQQAETRLEMLRRWALREF
jgi:hypothetical protein